jgi:hypothetical protein
MADETTAGLHIQCETDIDYQTSEELPFSLFVMYLNGERFFATEDGGYLLASPQTLTAVGETVILEADRNIGAFYEGSAALFVQRTEEGYRLLVPDGPEGKERKPVVDIPAAEWHALIARLQRDNDGNIPNPG